MHQLPIRVLPAEHESGHGFVLRALTRNGLNFSRAAAWLNLPWKTAIRDTDVRQWSWAVRVDSDWLDHRIPSSRQHEGHMSYGFMGSRWRGAHSFRLRNPQVCTACIRERQYCSATWDLMGVCLCATHRIHLTDTCFHCRKPLQWNRPGIDLCTCKRYLTHAAPQAPVDDRVVRWVEWVSMRLTEIGPFAHDPLLAGLPPELSIDGTYKVLLAFGLKTKGHEVLPATVWGRHISPVAMALALGRGIDRLTCALATGAWEALASVVHDPTLERLEGLGVSQADRDVARRLRRHVFGLENHGDPVLRYRTRGQLELFLKASI